MAGDKEFGSNATIRTPGEAHGAYRDMLIRLMSRQLYAETATVEVFGKAVAVAPDWNEKYLAAHFSAEEHTLSRVMFTALRPRIIFRTYKRRIIKQCQMRRFLFRNTK